MLRPKKELQIELEFLLRQTMRYTEIVNRITKDQPDLYSTLINLLSQQLTFSTSSITARRHKSRIDFSRRGIWENEIGHFLVTRFNEITDKVYKESEGLPITMYYGKQQLVIVSEIEILTNELYEKYEQHDKAFEDFKKQNDN